MSGVLSPPVTGWGLKRTSIRPSPFNSPIHRKRAARSGEPASLRTYGNVFRQHSRPRPSNMTKAFGSTRHETGGPVRHIAAKPATMLSAMQAGIIHRRVRLGAGVVFSRFQASRASTVAATRPRGPDSRCTGSPQSRSSPWAVRMLTPRCAAICFQDESSVSGAAVSGRLIDSLDVCPE
jgi:hypothetical protein